MLQINARMKEDMIRRSATQDGVFSLVRFFWEGTKMWLNIMRKMRNRIEEIPAMAAIQSEFSSSLIEKFKNFVPKFTVCTWENSFTSSLTVASDCSSWVTKTLTFRRHFSAGWPNIRGEIEFNRQMSWDFFTTYISCILGRNLFMPLFWDEASSCMMLRTGVIPIPPETRSRLSYLHKISNSSSPDFEMLIDHHWAV